MLVFCTSDRLVVCFRIMHPKLVLTKYVCIGRGCADLEGVAANVMLYYLFV